MAANTMFRQKLNDIQSQTEAEVEWWKTRRASIQDGFMKELESDSAATSTKASKPGSDEDTVLVEGGGPVATGSIRKKKGKK